MTATIVTRRIDAPVSKVFETVAQIENFSKALPHITKVEFLTDSHVGVGTRFRETRLMDGREGTTELEVTEYVEDEHVRIISDTHGTVWDTLFTVRAAEGQTELEMVMDARAYKLLPKLVNPLIKNAIKNAIEKDLDAVKAYCEGDGTG
jgi:carbon monoxide dehydrogenase subunit G